MKTPIMRPAIEAILFGFERIGMVIRIAWLPIVISIALYIGLFTLLIGGASLGDVDFASGDPEAAIETIVSQPGFIGGYILMSTVMPLVVSLILSCVYVAATRASTLADYEPPNLPFYFALGPRELKYFITRILYAILIILSTLVMVGAGGGVAAITAGVAQGLEGQAVALIVAPAAAVGLWLVLVWLWVILRFLPVLPIAAVENRIAFGDAWKMSKGNFWRILFSGALFLAILEGVVWVLLVAMILPAALVIGLITAFGYGVAGPAAFAALALLAIVIIPAIIALAAFSLAAEAAFPARLYAYLSGCGEACKIY